MQVHEKFNAADSDVTIRSSDDVLFKLHRVNLSLLTGAFPGTELATEDKDVQLTEPSVVLEIVFEFIYPKRYPSLRGTDFDLLLQVAEAVGKYEVFPAIQTCEARLRDHFKDHALQIMLHAVKHDYSELANDSSLELVLRPTLSIVEKLPSTLIITWLKYRDAWQKTFTRNTDLHFGYNDRYVRTSSVGCGWKQGPIYCVRCASIIKAWVYDLEQIESLDLLRSKISNHTVTAESDNPGCDSCQKSSAGKTDVCRHFSDFRKRLLSLLDAVPPFTDFVHNRQPEYIDLREMLASIYKGDR
ncbi:hypothetical protein CPC08DRAFT_683256 [Agrocybe pediades]|nr:hypothetical protein CPC08DRAFT_683256 [Agrocybe pediades]